MNVQTHLNQACTAAGTEISEAAPAPSRGYNALHTHNCSPKIRFKQGQIFHKEMCKL